jgi:hypothetical protein
MKKSIIIDNLFIQVPIGVLWGFTFFRRFDSNLATVLLAIYIILCAFSTRMGIIEARIKKLEKKNES